MGSATLDRLRRAALTVEIADGGLHVSPRGGLTQELREALVAHREEVRHALFREAAVEALDLATVDPATGDPELSAREPATEGQVQRLRELARYSAFREQREPVADIVEEAVEGGLTGAGAYVLIGRIGNALAENRDPGTGTPAGVRTCQDCGRKMGPTSKLCGRCKRIRADRSGCENAGSGP